MAIVFLYPESRGTLIIAKSYGNNLKMKIKIQFLYPKHQLAKTASKACTNFWYICVKQGKMAKNTSILLGDYFKSFIDEQIKSGKYSTASEVVRAALRVFEYEETKKSNLIKELKKGEESGFVNHFDREQFLERLNGERADSK